MGRGEINVSNEFIAVEIMGHTGGNKSHRYIIWLQGYDTDDTSNKSAQKIWIVLLFELLANDFMSNSGAKQG
jgi:hypothetical protein